MSEPIETFVEDAPTSRFYFNKKNPAPKNFDDLQVDKKATVTVKGKITSIRHDSDGKSFEITLDKVKIAISNSKPIGVSEGLEKIREERKA